VAVGVVIAALAAGGDGAVAGADLPRFSGERAFALLDELCALGPRVPGTKAHDRARDELASRFEGTADQVELEEFPAASPPYAAGIRLTNIVARFGPGRSPRVLIGAHWDSRPHADEDPDPDRRLEPVLGANDGAAGCALLLHLAELLHDRPPGVGVDLVLFDGEDGGMQDSLTTYCLGSREHVRRMRAPRPAYVIVLDMVGDRDLGLHAEGYSTTYAPDLVRMVWGRAAALGLDEFQLDVRYQVYDDHVPFLEAGIPAVDIIDFDYPFWHTVADTPDKCSAASLAAVGEVLVSLLYDP
jgi:Zn-dependent M28 family amino/carboxypeptidase